MERREVKTVVIDQNGDTIITLTKLEVAFAIWQPVLYHAGGSNGLSKGKERKQESAWFTTSDTTTTTTARKKKSNAEKKKRLRREEEERLAKEIEEAELARLEEETAAIAVSSGHTIDEIGDASIDHGATIQSPDWPVKQYKKDHDEIPDEPVPEPQEEPEIAVEYRVSSKHLEMASGKFRRELSGQWGESRKGEDGLYHLTAEDWDPEVFSILLNILHLRNRHVPSSLTMARLAKIAVLVDYYRCWDAVAVWTKIWIPEVKKKEPVPAVYNRELILWMLIAWVFELTEDFNITTKIALRQSDTPTIQDMYLPIPPVVIGAIELRRYEAIDAIISTCHDWFRKFCNNYKCPHSESSSFSCGSILLGNLTKGMRDFGYLWPRPDIPFKGHSFEGICKRLKELKSPQDFHHCTLNSTLGGDIDIIAASTEGLRLQDFKDRAKQLEQM